MQKGRQSSQIKHSAWNAEFSAMWCDIKRTTQQCHSVFGHETQDELDSDSSLWQLHSRDLCHKYLSVMPDGIFFFFSK